MNSTTLSRSLTAGMLAAALLGGGAVVAAAGDKPNPPASGVPAANPDAKRVTVKVDRKKVKAWEEFRITGRAENVRAGSMVQLEQKQWGTWVPLPVRTTVNPSGTYGMRVKLGLLGRNELRTVVHEDGRVYWIDEEGELREVRPKTDGKTAKKQTGKKQTAKKEAADKQAAGKKTADKKTAEKDEAAKDVKVEGEALKPAKPFTPARPAKPAKQRKDVVTRSSSFFVTVR